VGEAVEIITGVERRRRWRLEEKLRIVAEVEQPGVSFADVARRHEVSRGLLWNWRRLVRQGLLVAEPMAMFTPVRITADPPSPERRLIEAPPLSRGKAGVSTESDRIEIALPDGTCIRVGADVGLAALRRVMTAVRR
jgi:transposase